MISYEQAKAYIESNKFDLMLEQELIRFIQSNSVVSQVQTDSDYVIKPDYEISSDIQSHTKLSDLPDNIDSRPKFNYKNSKGGNSNV